MTTQTIDETVLAAYLKGELDPEGSEAVERWYDASAENPSGRLSGGRPSVP